MLLRVSTLAGVALAALSAAPLLPVAQAWGALGHYMVCQREQEQAHESCALHATMRRNDGAMLYRAGADGLPSLLFSATCCACLWPLLDRGDRAAIPDAPVKECRHELAAGGRR
jgi:hypothetical protein